MSDYTRTSPKSRRANWVTEAVYDYRDQTGGTAFRVHRQVSQFGTNRPEIDERTGKQKKRCWQQWLTTEDGKKPRQNAPVLPYRLPELLVAVERGDTVLVVEGEKKVETLRALGFAATCNDGGAGKWLPEHAAFLLGANVVILPDNDEPGRRHADRIGRWLGGVAVSVRLLELPDLPDHGDVVDWVNSGGTGEQFATLVEAAPEWHPYNEPDEPDQRTKLVLRTGMLHQQADEAENGLVAANAPVFTQGGTLVRSVVEEADASRGRKTLVARIVPSDRSWLMRQLSQTVRCVKLRKSKDGLVEVATDVPRPLVEAVLSTASPKFSELAGIIETPTLRPDGSILSEPGYDPATGLLLVNPPPMPRISERPSRAEAEAALRTLNGPLCEFPFADEPSRTVALSALITPVVRGALQFAPLHVATAPVAGSGKSYLFDTASAIAAGKACPVLSAGASNEETEKRLHGAALSGQPIISIDNLNGTLRGDFLCQLVTQARVEVRRLGSTGNTTIQNKTTVFANGNNIEIEGDLVRRTIRCSLNPEMENPETRQFKGNPIKMVLADRGKFVAAVLTLVRAHLVAGAPQQQAPLAGFEDWSRLVRDALMWLGCADPVATQETLRAEDPAVAALDAVLETWVEALSIGKLPDEALTVRQLLDRNWGPFENQLRSATRTRDNDVLSEVKVGKFFTRHKERIRKGVKLVSEINTRTKQQKWSLKGWREFTQAEAEVANVVELPTTTRDEVPLAARRY
ncbi:hypothetical protein IVB56_27265 [Bradyrhizobium sp. CW7]|uniref:hypothetical protein n=1 Tax=Bradyrhizobium sp. CW7 TaxID=2782688 RepID=UPI001FF80EC0|nr:hypothetical protein [Bradyrhizobium sp. CW7]MCK1354648.1 hypothetical protein [Bradyrhizobium sp. CW7]